MPPDKDPATAAAEAAAKELVRTAYGDLLQPAARVVGAELGDFVSAIVVAGRGFGYLIREKYAPFVQRAISRVPEQRRMLPAPEILGPILEGVTYLREGTELSDMFEALLSCAADSDRSGDSHPSFPGMLQRLSPDEARLLKAVSEVKVAAYYNTILPNGAKSLNRISGHGNIFEHPNNQIFYMSNLFAIGVLATGRGEPSGEKDASGVEGWKFEVTLSETGIRFMAACSTGN
jgi:hypothetical protein